MEAVSFLITVTTNLGQGYDKTSGVFTAPTSGVYFLVGMAAPAGNKPRAYLRLVVDGTAVADSNAYQESDHYQTGTCHIVLHLRQGQRAWLEAYQNGHYWGHSRTAFSGFLIGAYP